MTEPNTDETVTPPAVKYAVLDTNGVLLSFTESEVAGAIAVPHDCDLQPGKYQWDGQAFTPVMSMFRKDAPAGDPDSKIAIALALRAIGRQIPLPAYTKSWLAGFDRYPDDLQA